MIPLTGGATTVTDASANDEYCGYIVGATVKRNVYVLSEDNADVLTKSGKEIPSLASTYGNTRSKLVSAGRLIIDESKYKLHFIVTDSLAATDPLKLNDDFAFTYELTEFIETDKDPGGLAVTIT
jgi:hypothetical protein